MRKTSEKRSSRKNRASNRGRRGEQNRKRRRFSGFDEPPKVESRSLVGIARKQNRKIPSLYENRDFL
ncbi:hypothetical protein L596_019047 [Steinernema carpocapsae]|uniref:Uncharacterized protein n=1 Tax=Steinernema carpocapsae TaxID=34508 RepID=A0A4U5N6N6_STECR|nr:hypothetical protein L596_019047 [Steinernema carpocapsae]